MLAHQCSPLFLNDEEEVLSAVPRNVSAITAYGLSVFCHVGKLEPTAFFLRHRTAQGVTTARWLNLKRTTDRLEFGPELVHSKCG